MYTSTVRQAATAQPTIGPSAGVIAFGLAAAWTGATLANVAIAAIAHAAGVSSSVMQLQVAVFAPLTIVGVIAGAGGWAVIRRFSRRPAATLRWLVPTVLVASWIPDLLLLGGAGVGAVLALMSMHLAVAAVAVPVYARVLPVRDAPPR